MKMELNWCVLQVEAGTSVSRCPSGSNLHEGETPASYRQHPVVVWKQLADRGKDHVAAWWSKKQAVRCVSGFVLTKMAIPGSCRPQEGLLRLAVQV